LFSKTDFGETETNMVVQQRAAADVLSHFWGLASLNAEERLTAATSLVDALTAAQTRLAETSVRPLSRACAVVSWHTVDARHVPQGSSEVTSDDLAYSVKRLV
jgi:hypothetical protein